MHTLKRSGKNHEGQPFKIHISEDDKSLCGRIKPDKNWKISTREDSIFKGNILDIDGKIITEKYCRWCAKIYINENL